MDENANGNSDQDRPPLLPEVVYKTRLNRKRKTLRDYLHNTTAYGGTRFLAASIIFVALIQLVIAFVLATDARGGDAIPIILTSVLAMLFLSAIAQILVLSADRADAQLEMLHDHLLEREATSS